MIKQKTLPAGHEYELYTEIKELFHTGASRLHKNKLGPKTYTDLQRVALLILYVRSNCSLRRFCEVYLLESRWPSWLGLREIPSKSSIHNWLRHTDMSSLRELNKQLLADQKPEIMAIDGTGIDSWQASRHYEKRINLTRRDYAKVDIITDTNTLLIHDWSLVTKPRHDAYIAKKLLSRTPQRGVLILGDKGYDAKELYKICHENKNRFYAPIKNAPGGKPPKRLGWHKRKSHRVETDYHRRSLVESTIRSLKTRITALRSRLHYMKKREFALHVLARNLEIKISLLLRTFLARLEVLVRFAHHT